MSTNNNRLGKEVHPIWKDEETSVKKIKKLSGLKLAGMVSNELSECTALCLSGRGIEKLEDFHGFSSKLRRVDLSDNDISRLAGLQSIDKVSMLNISSNKLSGDSSLEDLRYLTELRTLNMGRNDEIGAIRSHIVKPLTNLQALICNDCNLERISFVRFLPSLNTFVASHNRISSFSCKELGKFENLIKLSLGHNSFTQFPDLSGLPNLHELRLNNNKISSIPDQFFSINKKVKILDVSHNQISDWKNIQDLTNLKFLTNLTLIGNPLPPPPADIDTLSLREDISADTIMSPEERAYRHYVLYLFQKKVGQFQKDFIQLVVLDNRRVKTKWTQGGASKNRKDLDVPRDGMKAGMIMETVDVDAEDSPLHDSEMEDSFPLTMDPRNKERSDNGSKKNKNHNNSTRVESKNYSTKNPVMLKSNNTVTAQVGQNKSKFPGGNDQRDNKNSNMNNNNNKNKNNNKNNDNNNNKNSNMNNNKNNNNNNKNNNNNRNNKNSEVTTNKSPNRQNNNKKSLEYVENRDMMDKDSSASISSKDRSISINNLKRKLDDVVPKTNNSDNKKPREDSRVSQQEINVTTLSLAKKETSTSKPVTTPSMVLSSLQTSTIGTGGSSAWD